MGITTVNGVKYVNTTGPVSIKDIQASTGSNSWNLGSFRSSKWYKSDFTRGNHPSGTIKFSDFRGKSGTIPHVDRTAWPAAGKFFASGSITLPRFNTLQIHVYAAGGGGGGYNGSNCIQFNPNGTCANAVVVNGGAGGTGGTTSISIATGSFSASGGTGGNQGTAGSRGTPQDAAGAGGGAGNGAGGMGGTDATPLYDADVNYTTASSLYATTFTPTYGAAGAAGSGGSGNLTSGNAGSAGTAGGVTVFVDPGLY